MNQFLKFQSIFKVAHLDNLRLRICRIAEFKTVRLLHSVDLNQFPAKFGLALKINKSILILISINNVDLMIMREMNIF